MGRARPSVAALAPADPCVVCVLPGGRPPSPPSSRLLGRSITGCFACVFFLTCQRPPALSACARPQPHQPTYLLASRSHSAYSAWPNEKIQIEMRWTRTSTRACGLWQQKHHHHHLLHYHRQQQQQQQHQPNTKNVHHAFRRHSVVCIPSTTSMPRVAAPQLRRRPPPCPRLPIARSLATQCAIARPAGRCAERYGATRGAHHALGMRECTAN